LEGGFEGRSDKTNTRKSVEAQLPESDPTRIFWIGKGEEKLQWTCCEEPQQQLFHAATLP
jgi:hypothetical protein